MNKGIRSTVTVALLSLVLLVVSMAVLWPRPDTAVSAPPLGLSETAESPSGRPRLSPGPVPADLIAPPADGVETPGHTARPVRLSIESLSLSQRVRPVGVAADGQMDLPADPEVLGWYHFGPAPLVGRGSVVFAGHLDSRRYGLGPLVRLRDVEVGARVLVTLASGRAATYVVRRIDRYDRQALPVELFSREGPELLRLVTCGGAYDPDAGGYQQNLVVTATPAGERP